MRTIHNSHIPTMAYSYAINNNLHFSDFVSRDGKVDITTDNKSLLLSIGFNHHHLRDYSINSEAVLEFLKKYVGKLTITECHYTIDNPSIIFCDDEEIIDTVLEDAEDTFDGFKYSSISFYNIEQYKRFRRYEILTKAILNVTYHGTKVPSLSISADIRNALSEEMVKGYLEECGYSFTTHSAYSTSISIGEHSLDSNLNLLDTLQIMRANVTTIYLRINVGYELSKNEHYLTLLDGYEALLMKL